MTQINVTDLELIDLKSKELTDYGWDIKKSYIITGGSPEQRRELMESIISKHKISNEPVALELITPDILFAVWNMKNLLSPVLSQRHYGSIDPQEEISKVIAGRGDYFPEQILRHSLELFENRWNKRSVWLEEFGTLEYDQEWFGLHSGPYHLPAVRGKVGYDLHEFITTPLTLQELEGQYFKLDGIEEWYEVIEISETCEKFTTI